MEEQRELNHLQITVLAEDSVEYESPLLGQHGISFLVKTIGYAQKNILVDVGQNPDALLYNMKKLNIFTEELDSIVLTHCHYDHTQGLSKVLRAIGKKGVPVIAHPSIFRLHFIKYPYLRHVGMMEGDSREDIEKAGGRLFLTEDPLDLVAGLITTGEVPRKTDFENPGIALSTIDNGKLKEDQVLDDISIVACVKNKGIVIITGCSHAGIVNITQYAVELTGITKIEGIIGGFHLIEASKERIDRTVDALSQFDVNWIAAGHCTGFHAQVALYNKFGEKFIPLRTGMNFNI